MPTSALSDILWYNAIMRNFLNREKRSFFRHPINVPIQLRMESRSDNYVSESKDISLGGLCFIWPSKLTRGSLLTISIPVKEKVFDVRGRVAYSTPYKKSAQYRTGASLVDAPHAFKARLAEEVLHIIEYQKTLSRQLGYDLTEEEAAKQWVTKYAEKFPK